MSKAVKTILGIVGAAAVGAAVGVAYAPDKGSKTRKKLQRKMTDASEEFQTFAGNAKDKTLTTASEVLGNGKEKVSKIVDSVSSTVSKISSKKNDLEKA